MSTTAPAPRDRTLPLLAVIGSLCLIGSVTTALSSWGGEVPAPCHEPATRGVELRCDGEGEPPGARAWLVGGRLDVNRASARELEKVPGIGPALARSVVAERERRGGFRDLSELDDIRGIGPKKLAALELYVEVVRR